LHLINEIFVLRLMRAFNCTHPQN